MGGSGRSGRGRPRSSPRWSAGADTPRRGSPPPRRVAADPSACSSLQGPAPAAIVLHEFFFVKECGGPGGHERRRSDQELDRGTGPALTLLRKPLLEEPS